MLRPMTQEEVHRSIMGIANPGLFPLEELTNPISTEKYLSLSVMLNRMFNYHIGVTGNMTKMQREICNVTRRVTAVDGGGGRRPNPGRRLVNTAPVSVGDLQWQGPNENWAVSNYQDIPTSRRISNNEDQRAWGQLSNRSRNRSAPFWDPSAVDVDMTITGMTPASSSPPIASIGQEPREEGEASNISNVIDLVQASPPSDPAH